MRLLSAFVLAVLVVVTLAAYTGDAAQTRCRTGEAAAFLSVRPYAAGTLPGEFTSDAGYFSRRYNCQGRSAEARRVDLGVYDVRFPGLSGRMAVVSAISQEGVSASVLPLSGGSFRVSLRGPLIESGVMLRRDVAFSIVVY